VSGDAREHVRAWLDYERRTYADQKYAPDKPITQALVKDAQDNPHMEADGHQDIDLFIGNYLSRVKMFGLDSLQGRQAMGKLIVTLTDHLERAVSIHGPMPTPGVSSGNIIQWSGDTHDA
jgi:hypothetical protein